MAILSKGTDFTTGDQVTAAKLDALVDNATFASGAVDDSTTQLDGCGRIIVKDGGITSAKLNLNDRVTITDSTSFLVFNNTSQDVGFIGTDSGTGNFSINAGGSTDELVLKTNGVSRLTIDNDGNVGIGIASPQATLHVADQGSDKPCILVQNASSDEGDIAVIDGEALQIGHWSGSSFTERMAITSSGQVLIGTTTVDGTGGASFRPNFDDGAARLTFNRANTTNNSVVLQFDNNGSGVGQIVHDNSATTYSTSSDYRLKEDILEIQDSLSRVQALKPINFAWKIDGRRADGFLAHEAQEGVPEAVIGDKDAVDEDGQPDYQGIDQSKLVPLLTKALQEALTKIEALEARVSALES